MKNLILTFVFSLVSLVTFAQLFTVTCEVLHSDGSTFTTTVTESDTIFVEDTIYVNLSDNLKFTSNLWAVVYEDNNELTNWNNDATINNISYTEFDTITYAFMSADGEFTDYLKITVIVGDQSASTQENTLTREELKVYPSPATSDIKISFSADKSDMPLNIFSLNGQLVHQDNTLREVGAINTIELNVSGWVTGIYFVKVGNHTEKLIIE